ncbi:class I SAM-dependent methyltransferase [Croceitalea rosinachiae]|uniref:Methyltransferase domain-containing protein n=1 Tax=Croceitalea rosinachiae TaxID=3075596 RepID=A0ABU3ACH2_9FLAO|nr:methyltransferase domain-containing protein [Croceitalea sp. F388]MDT0607575.1 methyltransferase domain-containing protein [Croceitalea sp. F388]
MKFRILILLFVFSVFGYSQYTESEWNDRDDWMRISDFFEITKVQKGNVIADIGCHEGYMSIHLAKRVGENGKIYAVDLKKYRLDALEKNAKNRGIENISTVLGDYDNPKLPINIFDAIYIIDTYHEIEDYHEVLEHVNKSLKPNGKLILLEKLKSRIKGKPRRQQVEAHSLASKYVKKELQEAGFKIEYEESNFGLWERNPGKQIWFVIAVPNN